MSPRERASGCCMGVIKAANRCSSPTDTACVIVGPLVPRPDSACGGDTGIWNADKTVCCDKR
eukprot:9604-Heterococcus_DN1.PRE.2